MTLFVVMISSSVYANPALSGVKLEHRLDSRGGNIAARLDIKGDKIKSKFDAASSPRRYKHSRKNNGRYSLL